MEQEQQSDPTVERLDEVLRRLERLEQRLDARETGPVNGGV